MKQTAETSGMIFIILLGSEVFDAFLALLAAAGDGCASWSAQSGLPPYAVIISLMLFYILLGAVMDELAMILLTLPVFFPDRAGPRFRHAARRGGDLVRHPRADRGGHRPHRAADRPQRVRHQLDRQDVPIASTYRGVLPFIVTDIVRLGLVIAFPGLALWLVRLLN